MNIFSKNIINKLNESAISYTYELSLPDCNALKFTDNIDIATAKKEYMENEGANSRYSEKDIKVTYFNKPETADIDERHNKNIDNNPKKDGESEEDYYHRVIEPFEKKEQDKTIEKENEIKDNIINKYKLNDKEVERFNNAITYYDYLMNEGIIIDDDFDYTSLFYDEDKEEPSKDISDNEINAIRDYVNATISSYDIRENCKPDSKAKLEETGEWDDSDPEMKAQLEQITKDGKKLAKMVKGDFIGARGFDEYQGPYVNINTPKHDMITIWFSQDGAEGTYLVEVEGNYIAGTIYSLADIINQDEIDSSNYINESQIEDKVPYDNTTTKICPRCGKEYTDYPALSRRDNETYICPECGQAEAFEDCGLTPKYDGKPYWNENK